MTAQRGGHATAALPDGRIIVVGGYDWWQDRYSSSGREDAYAWHAHAEIFDPTTKTFVRIADMPDALSSPHVFAIVDGNVAVLNDATNPLVWRGTENAWRSCPAVTQRGSTFEQLATGEILMAGGTALDRKTASARAWLFDAAACTWSNVADMGSARIVPTSARLKDGRILVAGGYRDGKALASSETFDPVTRTWTAVGDMSSPRAASKAVGLSDGRILVHGKDGVNYTECEVFDPATNRWQVFPGPGVQSLTNLVALTRGRLIATRGQPAEIFFYDGASWRTDGKAERFGSAHRATVLKDDTVLLTGGEGSEKLTPCPAEGAAPCILTRNESALYTPP